MNIQKYLLPASLAATAHVALLWLMPEESYIRTIEVPLVSWKPPVVDPPVEPPEVETKPDHETEVKPVAGGSDRVELPEPAMPAKPEDIRITVPDKSVTVIMDRDRISPATGPGGPDLPGDWTGGRTIIAAGLLDRVPSAKVQLPPDYPASMRHSGASGSVLVEFDVDASGRVVRAEAIRWTDREFVEPAVRAVKKWRFEPGRRNGQAVPFRMAVPIEFGIEGS
jgi:protein TonB